MSLRGRTWLIVGLASVVTAALLALTLPSVLLRGFLDLERDDMRVNLDRAVSALQQIVDEQATKIGDWSNWDDTYQFAADHNRRYLDRNVTRTGLASIPVNVFVVLDAGDRVVYARDFDLRNGTDQPVPDDLVERLAAGSSLCRHGADAPTLAGLLMLDRGALIFATRPILDSREHGPAHGTLLFGRWLGPDMVSDLAARTHLDLTVHRLDQRPAALRLAGAPALLAPGDTLSIRPVDSRTIAGYRVVRDLDGRSALALEARLPRHIHAAGLRSMRLVFGCVLAVVLLLGALIALMLERTVLRRLTRLRAEVGGVGRAGNPDARVAVEGHDEISMVAAGVNGMLESIAASQARVRESESLLRTFFDQGGIERGIAELDGDDLRFVQLNQHVAAAFGATVAQAIGRSPRELGAGDAGVMTWVNAFRECRRAGELIALEFPFQRPDRRVLLSVVICPLEDEPGRLPRFAFAAEDVTARRRAEADLREARDAAESANRAKSQFLATMSHEIRTPMNGVLGLTSLLLETKLDATQQDYARLIHSSADALLDLLNDILDLSKIEADRMTLEPLPFDLRSLIEDLAELMQGRAREKDLEIVVRFAAGTPRWVVGDSTRIRQVLLNLIGNAVKFTRSGCVVIEASGAADDAGRSRLRLGVSDTGVGIPLDRQARLFQRFSQADASTTRQFGGSGLGLAISKKLVELMGGTIGFTSEEGVGSTFWAELPLPVAPEEPSRWPRPRAGVRVLLVDDLAPVRGALRETLADAGAVVRCVASGEEALAELRSAPVEAFDALLVDRPLAGGDGARWLRALDGDRARIPRVLLVREGDGPAAAGDGWAAVLPKPVRAHLLLAALEAVTRRPEGRPTGVITGHSLAEAFRAATAPAVADERFAGLHVLVAEDNATNLKVVLRMLERLGCSAEAAENGMEALERAGRGHFDVVLMDVQMPVLDGLDATRAIRGLPAPAGRVPVVALTANSMAAERDACFSAGMDDFVSKPIRREELVRVIRAARDLGARHRDEAPPEPAAA